MIVIGGSKRAPGRHPLSPISFIFVRILPNNILVPPTSDLGAHCLGNSESNPENN